LRRVVIIVLIAIIAIIFLAGILVLLSKVKGGMTAGFSESAQIELMYKDAARYLAKQDEKEAVKIYEKVMQKFTQSPKRDLALFAVGNYYQKIGKFDQAKTAYTDLLSSCPESLLLKKTQEQLGDLNIKILFSPIITSDSSVYEVKRGDNLTSIAKASGTTVDLIKKSNNLSSDTIRVGSKLKVIKSRFSVIVDKSQNILTLKSNEDVLKTYPVSTGLDNCTPIGNFKVVNKIIDPTWYSAEAIVPPSSPENILGTRWMGLSIEGYGIHGTTDPGSIGRSVTAGCVRMRNSDVEELYTILPVGTVVTVVD